MALADDLKEEIRETYRAEWSKRDGRKVPEVEDVQLGNDAVEIDATVLYADMAGSTDMVDSYKWWFSAEVYKTYLLCASRIIKAEGGVITAFDGDRVMGVFFEGTKNTNAVRSALKIKYAVTNFINPLLKERYPSDNHNVRHTVGIDTSKLRVARTGVWGSNDLVWVGRAANYAAKLSSLDEAGYYTFITNTVYDSMNDDAKTSAGKSMWEARSWTQMNGMTIYRSSWGWVVD